MKFISVTTNPDTESTANLKEYTGAYLISFAVFSERFSFWGLQAIMVLFLMHVFAQSEQNAFILLGSFGALSYALSVFGGGLSDKYLGAWKSCYIGLFLCLLGNTILVFSNHMTSLNVGLACILVGAGLFSPSSNTIVRMLYEKKSDLKESAFLIMCVAGNISGTLAPLIYGLFGANGLWHNAFLMSAIFNFASLLFLCKYSSHFREQYVNKNFYLGLVFIFIFIGISLSMMIYKDWLRYILFSAIIPVCYFIFQIYKQLTIPEKKRIHFILLLTTILMLFYIAVFQIYSSLTIFIDHYVNRNLMRWSIPVPAFASLQCIFFIACAPIVDRALAILRKKGYVLSLLVKIQIGLLIGAIGFLFFASGEWSVHRFGYCGIVWIILGNLFLGLGEVFLYPPILNAIATFSPKRFSSTFMGFFSISLAFASYFSGQIAKTITDSIMISANQNTSLLHLVYAKVAMVLIGIVLLSLMIFNRLKKWYHEQEKLI